MSMVWFWYGYSTVAEAADSPRPQMPIVLRSSRSGSSPVRLQYKIDRDVGDKNAQNLYLPLESRMIGVVMASAKRMKRICGVIVTGGRRGNESSDAVLVAGAFADYG